MRPRPANALRNSGSVAGTGVAETGGSRVVETRVTIGAV
jgi:hypothetical protein